MEYEIMMARRLKRAYNTPGVVQEGLMRQAGRDYTQKRQTDLNELQGCPTEPDPKKRDKKRGDF